MAARTDIKLAQNEEPVFREAIVFREASPIIVISCLLYDALNAVV